MGRILKAVPAALAVPGLLFVVSCGSGGEADDTSREITSEQLTQMVLTLDQFGPEYASFAPDEKNGVVNIDTASEDDFDPTAERGDLQTFGFASGYEAYYSAQEATAGGSVFLGSQTVIFETADGAAGYFDDSITELSEDLGRTSGDTTLIEAEKFDVDTAANEAVGMRGVARFTNEDGSSTDVWIAATQLRRGRLLGAVAIYAIGADDLEKQRLEGKVKGLASVMNDRIASVLATAAPAAAAQ